MKHVLFRTVFQPSPMGLGPCRSTSAQTATAASYGCCCSRRSHLGRRRQVLYLGFPPPPHTSIPRLSLFVHQKPWFVLLLNHYKCALQVLQQGTCAGLPISMDCTPNVIAGVNLLKKENGNKEATTVLQSSLEKKILLGKKTKSNPAPSNNFH